MAEKNMNAKINVEFDEDYQSRTNINSGENISSLFAKIRRFILDLKPVAFSGDAETVNGHTVESNVPALGYYYATCDSPLTTNIKTVTCEGFEFKEGARITVRFTAGNGENPPSAPVFVLKINEDAGRPIAYNDWDGEGILGIIDSKKSEAFCGNQVWDFIFINGRFIMQVPLRGYQMDDTLSDRSSNPVQNKVIKQAIDNKADKTVATTSADGLMSASDKTKLDSADDTYALKSKYGDITINVGRKAGTDVGSYSTAEGFHTIASGGASHAEGVHTTASGTCSHAGGYNTIASHNCEVAYGNFNVSNENTLFSIGDGTADDTRHNAFEITTTGGKLHDKDIATIDDIPTSLPADGGNANTVGGKSADDFAQIIDFGFNQTDTKIAIGKSGKTTIYRCSNWTGYPSEFIDSQGTLIAINYNGSGTVGTDNIWCIQFIINPRQGTRIYVRYIDSISVSEWKEISTMPIKSEEFTASTDAWSHIQLFSTSENKKPLAVIFVNTPRMYSVFYHSGYCYLELYNNLMQTIPNTSVNFVLYYMEV